MVQNLPASAGDMGSIPWSERSPGGENDKPLWYSGKSHGQRSLKGCGPWGHKRVAHNLATKPQLKGSVIPPQNEPEI